MKHYVGAFYRRTSNDGLDDLHSVGDRAGAYLQFGRNAYLDSVEVSLTFAF